MFELLAILRRRQSLLPVVGWSLTVFWLINLYGENEQRVTLETASVTDARRLLTAAQAYRDMGRSGLAFHTYEEVLAFDPGNTEAIQGEDHIRDAMRAHGFSARWNALYWGSSAGKAAQQKVSTIIFPNVDFDKASLQEVADLLRKTTCSLVPKTTLPDISVINIVLEAPTSELTTKPTLEAEPVSKPLGTTEPVNSTPVEIPGVSIVPEAESLSPPQTLPELSITLHLKSVPLLGFLEEISIQTGLHLLADRDGLRLEQERGRDDEPTLFYDLTPEALNFVSNPNIENLQRQTFIDAVVFRHQDPKPWLQAYGMRFPPGASAIYKPEKCQLIVRNTADQLESIEMFIDP